MYADVIKDTEQRTLTRGRLMRLTLSESSLHAQFKTRLT